MPRICRLQGGLTSAVRSVSRSPAFSTTSPVSGVREKLWKGDAPGAKDPYVDRPADTSDPVIETVQSPPKMSKRQRYIAASPLKVPQLRVEASTEQQVATDSAYVPATTMDDLVETAPLKDWWEQPGHWGYLNQFHGFAPKKKEESNAVVEIFLRRAVAEVLALREAGKLADVVSGRTAWIPPPPGGLYEDNVLIEVHGDTATVKNGKEIVEGLERKVSKLVWRHVRASMGDEHATNKIKAMDTAWKDIRLDDELKFAIRKRLFQFTGNYIPDAKLGAVTKVKHLLTFGTQQPKPAKLAEELDQKELFDELANVRRQDTKMRTIQKETEVGRWKVIEEELEKRELPATGTGNLSGNKEGKVLRGER